MDRIRIRGGRQLKGEIVVSGSKNACLPLMVAAMLTDKPLTLKNVPRLADITTMIALLKQHGVEISAAPGENGDFLLKHGVGAKPAGSEVDTPLDYGDYYFLEGLMRFRKLRANGSL
jgi:5-enolpyruvylshikimate-3-phosphate synthase